MSTEQKELIDHELRQPATVEGLLNNKTPEQLAKLVIHHALDARRLLGAIDAANLYLDSGQPGEAHRIIRDAVDFYGLLLAMRAKGAAAMNTEALVKEFEPTIRGIAGKLCKRSRCWNEFNDLIQTGYVALLEAAARYQTDRGASLKTFLKIRIEGAMLDEMRRNDSASRDCRRFRREQQNAQRRLFIHLQREPSAQEMAYELDMTLERYRKLNKRTTATELPYPDENGNEQEPIIPPTPQDNPADREQQRRDMEILHRSIDRLPQQEQLVMRDILNQTPYETIKARFQCSDSRISQIRSKGVKRLKTTMGEVA